MPEISTSNRLGIIAGAGMFPGVVLRGARQADCHVTVIGLRGLADSDLRREADVFRWSGIACLGHWIRILKRGRVTRVILAGSVTKSSMYGRFRLIRFLPDWTSLRLWFFQLKDKRNDAVLRAVADEFRSNGIIMEDCTTYSAEHLAPQGVLTRRQPTVKNRADVEFGWPIAKEIGRLDIGQAIAVKETEVIAVEAIEGTDRLIERAGELCPAGGWILIKVAKPNQDMRFDVPTIGPNTIANLNRNGGRGLVIEAGKTVVLDRQETIAGADAAGIWIQGQQG